MATAKKVPARRGRPPKPKAKPMKVTPAPTKPVSYRVEPKPEPKPDLSKPAVAAVQAAPPPSPPALPKAYEQKLARFAADNHKLGAEVQQLKAENGKLKKVKDDLAAIEESHRELGDRITALRQSTE